MSLSFRRRIRILPGFTINLSKSGLSATVGIRGASVNIGKQGNYLNLGIPGTGLYSRSKLGHGGPPSSATDSSQVIVPPASPDGFRYTESTDHEIKSFNPELITSEGLYGLKESILHARHEKADLQKESLLAVKRRKWALIGVICTHLLIFGIFVKSIRQNYRVKVTQAKVAIQDYENYKLSIVFNCDKAALNDLITLRKSFEDLCRSQRIWDVTSSRQTDRIKERTTASQTVGRTLVNFESGKISIVETVDLAYHFRNANGGDLFIYPQFIIVAGSNDSDFGVLDLRHLEVISHHIRFIETEGVPSDSVIVGKSWKYSNKDGSRDKRFGDNYEIPIADYGELWLKSSTGLNECYEFSNAKACDAFAEALQKWIGVLSQMNWSATKLDETALSASNDSSSS